MKKNIFFRFFKAIKPYAFILILSIICAIINVISSLLIPIYVGNAIDLIIEINNVDFVRISEYFIKIGICLVCSAISQYVMSLLNTKLISNFVKDLRNEAFNKIHKLPISYLDSHPSGDIVSRVISDIDNISEGFLLGFNQLFTGAITIICTIAFMFLMNYIMALIVVILTPISLLVAKYISSNIQHHFKNQSIIKGNQTAFIDEIITGQKVIRAFNMEDNLQQQFETIAKDLETVALKANFFSSLVNPSTRFVNSIVYAVITFVGVLICINNPLFGVGTLTTFLSYASQYTKPFNDISSVISELQNTFVCANRLYEFLDEQNETTDKIDAIEIKDVSGFINFDNVCFSYDVNKKLIENINLKVNPGQRIAIVGPTGCGKTTLINLIMRFYDINNGSISIDGVDQSDITKSSLREQYGMVLQDTWIRHASLKDNILLGSEIDEDAFNKILCDCHLDSLVDKLPNGIETIIDDNGGILSQGQKQLICIARVMVNIPPMLILDEATSSIDTRTEIKINSTFLKLMEGRTTFIVAHRLSTIKEADVILVMKDGNVIEQGNHVELLNKKGFYYSLYKSQFEQ